MKLKVFWYLLRHTPRGRRSLLLALIAILLVGGAVGVYVITQNGGLGTASFAANPERTVIYTPGTNVRNAANQVGSNLSIASASRELLIGANSATEISYLGLRVAGSGIPANVTITKAELRLSSAKDQTAPVDVIIAADTDRAPKVFNTNSMVSSRTLTSATVPYLNASPWVANQGYSIDVTSLVQEVVKKNSTRSMSSFAFVIRGTTTGVSARAINNVRLTITYRRPGAVATSTPTPTITNTPTATATTTPPPSGAVGANSTAMGKWTPNPKFDTCTKEFHDSFKVQGPDGKWYPTWHPPVAKMPNGQTCTFGHEHGREPKGSLIWEDVRKHFAYDANRNNTIETSELATAGIPFGYINEQLDASNSGIHRHEDHVGHKVEFANGEPDIATDQFDSQPTAGVVVPLKNDSGNPKWRNSGARCYYFAKVHQGVSSHDAFTNNMHEVIYFSDCKGPTTAFDYKARTAVMMTFGKVGEFTNVCDAEGDRTTPVVLGTTDANKNYPGTRDNGSRLIIQRSCLEKHFLVPQGKFSMNMYEAWPGTVRITTAAGREVLTGANMLFDVEDANRYYYPGKPNNLGYSMELCYEKLSGGRQARGNPCEAATNYGAIKDITWDDPRSAFRGIHRGMYFVPPAIDNTNGSEYWYTDVFGKNASTTPFAGSVRQYVSTKKVNHNTLGQTDPRVNDRYHEDGKGTVHAPN